MSPTQSQQHFTVCPVMTEAPAWVGDGAGPDPRGSAAHVHQRLEAHREISRGVCSSVAPHAARRSEFARSRRSAGDSVSRRIYRRDRRLLAVSRPDHEVDVGVDVDVDVEP
jgi:hypothetical protein